VFCRLSGWAIGRRSFGKLPASSRSRKLWLTSARLFYRDGFFLSGLLCPREVTSRLYPRASLADVTDARSCVCICVRIHQQSARTQELAFYDASIPPGAYGGIVSVSTLTDEIAKTNAYSDSQYPQSASHILYFVTSMNTRSMAIKRHLNSLHFLNVCHT